VNFIHVLALLLTESLATAVAASNVGPSFTVDARTGKISPPSAEQLGKNALVPSFRLHDAYQNAFQRVVEMCILEGRGDYAPQQNDELWQNFLSWEQGIRSNLTSEMWETRPQELVGAWELMEVSGAGSLQAIMTAPTEKLFTEPMGAGVSFTKFNIVRDHSCEQQWYHVQCFLLGFHAIFMLILKPHCTRVVCHRVCQGRKGPRKTLDLRGNKLEFQTRAGALGYLRVYHSERVVGACRAAAVCGLHRPRPACGEQVWVREYGVGVVL
jgi:hypothetical protein